MMAKVERKRSTGVDLVAKVNDIFSRLPEVAEDDPDHLVQLGVNEDRTSDEVDIESHEIDGQDVIESDEPKMAYNLNITTNPFADLCTVTFDARRPPLFAMRFPDLFVCS